MIGSCLLQYGYSFMSKNNCCSIYMNKTFYGHTPNENGLLDLDRSDTHIHNIEAKRCKVNNDSATDTSILHHAFISIFIALWVVITHYVTILMHVLAYFTRFT